MVCENEWKFHLRLNTRTWIWYLCIHIYLVDAVRWSKIHLFTHQYRCLFLFVYECGPIAKCPYGMSCCEYNQQIRPYRQKVILMCICPFEMQCNFCLCELQPSNRHIHHTLANRIWSTSQTSVSKRGKHTNCNNAFDFDFCLWMRNVFANFCWIENDQVINGPNRRKMPSTASIAICDN